MSQEMENTELKTVTPRSVVETFTSTPTGLDTLTQTVSSTNVVPTPQVVETIIAKRTR